MKTFDRGMRRLRRRSKIALMMLLPKLVDPLFGDMRGSRRYGVANIASTAARRFGYSIESQKTVEAKIWRPTKPVAHVAAAFLFCLAVLRDTEEIWTDKYKLCIQQPFLAVLFYQDVFWNFLLEPAEMFRLQIPCCKRFHIGAKELIRFIID